ncbi:uncharacterized protein K441DRAFT_665890, partial [Cenococcum geophilum 1.58]|uniref:uncharacterized protein n=1 Tax=Cenococcum geophilum 1.58 TaxID=794803 RepID=UPI00358F00F2
LTVTSKKRIGGELYRQIRQLCIVVGTSGSMLLKDLVNNIILTASVLSLLIYLI